MSAAATAAGYLYASGRLGKKKEDAVRRFLEVPGRREAKPVKVTVKRRRLP